MTLFILNVGYSVTRDILHHLMDGVDPGDIMAAADASAQIHGVRDVAVRGRWMGRSLIIEVEGALPAETSLAEADSIGRQVEAAVRAAVPAARRVRWIPRSSSQ